MTDTNDNNNTQAIQVHANPDEESVCEVEEDAVQEEEVKAKKELDPEEQQNLKSVEDVELPDHDINEPRSVEIPYEPQKVVPTPVVIDEALPDDNAMKAQQQGTLDGRDDTCCVCRCCGFPNGAFCIIFGQFFLFCGLMLCGWALADCKFLIATAGYPERYYPPAPYYWNGNNYDPFTPSAAPSSFPTMAPPPDSRRGFGFIFNETSTQGCGFVTPEIRYWHADEFEYYADFLGHDWNVPRILSSTALGLGWLVFFGSLMLWCCTCVKAARYFTGTLILLVVGGLQSSAFAVIGSSFCTEEADCEPGRGFWMMLAGIICYLIASILFCFMSDYPGAVA